MSPPCQTYLISWVIVHRCWLPTSGLCFLKLALSASPARLRQPRLMRFHRGGDDYYAMELAAVDALQVDEVLVVSAPSGGCFWGELLATAARARGALGIVVDGYARDCHSLISMAFPTFVAGIYAADSLGRIEVTDYRSQIRCGGVTVDQGDLIIADYDGIVAIPAAVADDVVRLAEEKVKDEDVVRAKLREGMPVAEAFRRYGVL